jgi:hypothetical protein
MSTHTHIVDGTGSKHKAEVYDRDSVNGLTVYTRERDIVSPSSRPLLNDTYGGSLNQAVAFTGTPELIFDGGSGGTQWAQTALSGSWNFAATGKVTITSANDGDTAKFDDAGTIVASAYTALTGKIDLDTYSPVSNDITGQFYLAGVAVGISVSIADHIDEANFAEQSFAISLSEFVLNGNTVDEFQLSITRIGGTRPTIKFDDFQIEESGEPLLFQTRPAKETIYRATSLRLILADAVTGAAAQSYNKILAVSRLPIGVNLSVGRGGEVAFSTTIRDVADLQEAGLIEVNRFDDGTNTSVTWEVIFPTFLELDSRNDDFYQLTVNDDLSGLLKFTAFLRGQVLTL